MKSPGGSTKVERGKKSSSYCLSNFPFLVVSLFSYLCGLNEKKLPFLSLLRRISAMTNAAWIGVRKLPKARCTLDWTRRIAFCHRDFFSSKDSLLEIPNQIKSKVKAHTREGGPLLNSGGGTSLITSHRARGAPNPPTHSSITVFSWLALIDPYCIGIRRPFFVVN